MKTETGKSVAKTAYSKPLAVHIPYEYSWDAYETNDELVAAKDEMTLDEQRDFRNNARMANARQKELQTQLDKAGIVRPTAENDPQIALKDTFKSLQAAKLPDGTRKYTDEKAKALAADLIGVDWA